MYDMLVWVLDMAIVAVVGVVAFGYGRKYDRQQLAEKSSQEDEGVDMRSRIGK